MQFPIQDQYTYTSRENKQQKQLWYRIFHLEDTEKKHYGVLWYEQMPFIKCTDADETKGIWKQFD